MKKLDLCFTVGHSILANGEITSADGTSTGGVNEYLWCKDFVKILVEEARKRPEFNRVDMIVCPERQFRSAKEERTYKLNRINGKGYDLVVESHLNCFNAKAKGTESLYYPTAMDSKAYAQRINDYLDDIFVDRGAKGADLYILRETDCPAVLNEYFFCDNREDYLKADEYHEKVLIAKAVISGIIAKNIMNEASTPSTNPNSGKVVIDGDLVFPNGDVNKTVVTTANLNCRTARNSSSAKIIKTLPKGTKIKLDYCLNGWASTWDVTYQENGKTKPTFVYTKYTDLV